MGVKLNETFSTSYKFLLCEISFPYLFQPNYFPLSFWTCFWTLQNIFFTTDPLILLFYVEVKKLESEKRLPIEIFAAEDND